VFVGSADGLVSKFVVDQTPGMKQRLLRVKQTSRLGHEVFAMTMAGNSLVVGTRRHLHRLDPATLLPQQAPVHLPWEVGQPHHMAFGDVLPSRGVIANVTFSQALSASPCRRG
jgi:hypothetical protein